MSEEELKNIIVKSIKNGISFQSIAEEVHCSTRKLRRDLQDWFGRGYYDLIKLLYIPVLIKEIYTADNLTALASKHNLSSQGFSNLIHHYWKESPKKVQTEEIKMEMNFTDALLVMSKNPDEVYTLKKLGISRVAIKLLRLKGYRIKSIPGRKGGYSLGASTDTANLAWVNSWRRSMHYNPLESLF